jgi:hypothetical protein
MKALFSWFVATPFLYYCLAVGSLLGFGICAVLDSAGAARKWKSEWLVLALAGFTVLVWRWPTILWPQPLNIDEGQWAAGALKATCDFAPWRGFDGTTSGPLNSYVLALPALFGGQITFFSTRLIGFGLIMSAIYGLYFIVKWTHGANIASLAIVPPVAFLGLTPHWDFLHYSSEEFPIFLTTLGLMAGVYLATHNKKKRLRLLVCAAGGLCVGSTGFAKLQALPLALATFAFMIAVVFYARPKSMRESWVEAITLLATFGAVPAAIGITLWQSGEWEDAVISYIKSAAVYVSSGAMVGFKFFFGTVSSYTTFAICSLLLMVGGAIALCGRWNFTKRSAITSACALSFLFVCLLVIAGPRRPYPHYLLFSVLPLSYCVATVLRFTRDANLWRGRELFLSSVIIAWFLLPALSLSIANPPAFLGVVQELIMRANPQPSAPLPLRHPSAQIQAIQRYAPPGTRIAIWGWMPNFFVQTQTIMATRDAQTTHQLIPGPYQEYFRQRFVADLRVQPPSLFVDAVAPFSFGFDDRITHGFEASPALAAFIRENYLLKEDVEGVRFFVLKEGKAHY